MRKSGTAGAAKPLEILRDWVSVYNAANQLTSWTKAASAGGTAQRTVTLAYDGYGNRRQQQIVNATGISNTDSLRSGYTNYYWDAQDRLVKATHLAGTVTNTFSWEYDYRTGASGWATATSFPPPLLALRRINRP